MQTLDQLIAAFTKVNTDCEASGETVAPLTKDYVDYYELQLDYIGVNTNLREQFLNWLKTQN